MNYLEGLVVHAVFLEDITGAGFEISKSHTTLCLLSVFPASGSRNERSTVPVTMTAATMVSCHLESGITSQMKISFYTLPWHFITVIAK